VFIHKRHILRVEFRLSKHKALSSNPSTIKKKKKKEGRYTIKGFYLFFFTGLGWNPRPHACSASALPLS
jgi:hypothetical protein